MCFEEVEEEKEEGVKKIEGGWRAEGRSDKSSNFNIRRRISLSPPSFLLWRAGTHTPHAAALKIVASSWHQYEKKGKKWHENLLFLSTSPVCSICFFCNLAKSIRLQQQLSSQFSSRKFNSKKGINFTAQYFILMEFILSDRISIQAPSFHCNIYNSFWSNPTILFIVIRTDFNRKICSYSFLL